MKQMLRFLIALVCVSQVLGVLGCSDVAKRKKQSLARLRYSCSTPAMVFRRDAIVAALNEATPESLKRPHVVSAMFRGNIEKKLGFIIVDWISIRPLADGLILNLQDADTVRIPLHEDILAYNKNEAENLLFFDLAIGQKSHPDIWRHIRIESIASVQLTKEGNPVSNICKFRVVSTTTSGHVADEGNVAR